MAKLLLITSFLPLCIFAQSTDYTGWHDLTNELQHTEGGWGIGNACGVDFYLKGIIRDDLDMKGGQLQLLNSHVVIEGELLNVADIVYLCDEAILEVRGVALSVPELEPQEVKIYPNPARDEIHIKGIEVSNLELFDIAGRRLKSYTTVGNMHRIMIDDLASGIYILKINHSITHKIVKL